MLNSVDIKHVKNTLEELIDFIFTIRLKHSLQDFPLLSEGQYVVLFVHCEHLTTFETQSFIRNQALVKAKTKV